MAVLSRDDFMSSLRSLIGDRNDDEALAIMENFTDTYDNNGDITQYTDRISELEAERDRIDADWRDRYKARFWDGGAPQSVTPAGGSAVEEVTKIEIDGSAHPDESKGETQWDEETVTYDDLFN